MGQAPSVDYTKR